MKKIFSFVLIFVSIISCISFIGCGKNNGECDFKLKEIVYISFVDRSKNDTAGKITMADNAELVEECYEQIKDIKFNKKRSTKDFWTGAEIELEKPTKGMDITFKLKDESTWWIYVYDGRVYNNTQYLEYSSDGASIAVLLRQTLL